MKPMRLAAAVFIACSLVSHTQAQSASPASAPAQLQAVVDRILNLIDPPANAAPKTISFRIVPSEGQGLPRGLAGQSLEVAYQAPDRLRLSATINGERYALGRNGNELWAYNASRHFALRGINGVPAFSAAPADLDRTILPPFTLPLTRQQLSAMLLLVSAEPQPPQTIDGSACDVLKLSLWLKPDLGECQLCIRRSDGLPIRATYTNRQMRIQADIRDLTISKAWSAERWAIPAGKDDRVQRVALSHLVRFLDVAAEQLNNTIPTLGPATGQRRVVATAGKGRLELRDGARVLFLEGTPQEIGRQYGTLMRRQIRDVGDRMLYGVGVGSSLPKGSWFFGELESAQKRVEPFVSKDILDEMDAIADAAGIPRHELRLANFFPELFHCSGFAICGEATVDGRLYHGRILDYLRGFGLEQNAVVSVYRPAGKYAWVNIGYAGFVGSVTAMNEKHIAIGEMGGRGEGKWDGVPMAQLVRKVMEEAATLDEAVSIMKNAHRTCEYYYVISDGNSRRAVGICATPEKFETVGLGQVHPRLPHPVKDAVLLSDGQRYETLVQRVKANYGKLDAEAARHLMDPPVCMNSNIHSVLFAPETLDFWVANADSRHVASLTRYTKYNLAELLKGGSENAIAR